MVFSRFALLALLLMSTGVAFAQEEAAEEASSRNKGAKSDGTLLAMILGVWNADGGVVFDFHDDEMIVKRKDGGSEAAPFDVKAEDVNKLTLDVLDDKGRSDEILVLDVLANDHMKVTFETGNKKGKVVELRRPKAKAAAETKTADE